MIKSLGNRFTNYLKQQISLTDDEQAKINYAFQLIVGDLSKFIIMLILFSLFGYGLHYLMATATLMMIRPFTGGLHFKSYHGCLTFSLLFFVVAIFLNDYYGSFPQLTLTLYIIGTIIFMIIPAKPGPSRPIYSQKQKTHFKYILIVIIGLHVILFIFLKHNLYFTLASWVIFIQAIQLIISKGGFLYEIQNANQSINKCR